MNGMGWRQHSRYRNIYMIVLFGMHRLDMAGWREAILYTLYISTYLHEEKERERDIYEESDIGLL